MRWIVLDFWCFRHGSLFGRFISALCFFSSFNLYLLIRFICRDFFDLFIMYLLRKLHCELNSTVVICTTPIMHLLNVHRKRVRANGGKKHKLSIFQENPWNNPWRSFICLVALKFLPSDDSLTTTCAAKSRKLNVPLKETMNRCMCKLD